MRTARNAPTADLTLDDVLARLAASESIDGIAIFGSRASASSDPVSDYDVLLLVERFPVRIFQMVTHIGGRLADVVFVETERADLLLATAGAVAPTSSEGKFLLLLQSAQIVYDASGRLNRLHRLYEQGNASWLLPSPYHEVHETCFWLVHGLQHMKRISPSRDPVYQTSVDLMLLKYVNDVFRGYYCVRDLPWRGWKAAVRYLQTHDPEYLVLLRRCIGASDRAQKLDLYEQLVACAIAPVGGSWTPDVAAVVLVDPAQDAAQVEAALSFWESLVNQPSIEDPQPDRQIQ